MAHPSAELLKRGQAHAQLRRRLGQRRAEMRPHIPLAGLRGEGALAAEAALLRRGRRVGGERVVVAGQGQRWHATHAIGGYQAAVVPQRMAGFFLELGRGLLIVGVRGQRRVRKREIQVWRGARREETREQPVPIC